jgi:glyoxylase-like metal-dependent hydrolase (beta-lactamase superfamily II)
MLAKAARILTMTRRDGGGETTTAPSASEPLRRVRIHHLNCGTMCPPFARLVNGRGGLFSRGRMVCHCLLVETRDGLALVDTGLGTADVEDPRGRLGGAFSAIMGAPLLREETALAQVARLGFHRSDVRHLLPTHLDLDHAGGLSDFPDATVHLFEREHEAAYAPRSFLERERYRPMQLAHGPKWRLVETGGETWFGFESVRAIGGTDDEVLIVPLVGHTRGHCGIAVRGEGGRWVLHAGDAYFFHAEVHEDPPRSTPLLAGFQRLVEVDREKRLSNQRRLRELAREHGGEVTIVSAHCPVELERVVGTAASA